MKREVQLERLTASATYLSMVARDARGSSPETACSCGSSTDGCGLLFGTSFEGGVSISTMV
jgi:hypothetical protein